MEMLPAIRSIDDLKKYAEIMFNSGFFPDIKNIDQACVKIMAGQEMGIPPVASMRGVYSVRGQVSTSSQIMAALIKKSERYDYKIIETTKEQCKIEFFENGQLCGESTYPMDDAKTAKLMSNDVWQRHPKMMLFNRAMSNGAKMYCSEVFHGSIYVDGEIEETPIGDDSRPIPDMTGSQPRTEADNSLASEDDIDTLLSHLRRLGIRKGHEAKLVSTVCEGPLTTAKCNSYTESIQYESLLPWEWFSTYVNMLLADHPNHEKGSLRAYVRESLGAPKSGAFTADQQSKLIDWLLKIEPEPTPEAEPEAVAEVVSEPDPEATADDDTDRDGDARTDTDDTYTPDMTVEPSPWLAVITEVQNKTHESLEQVEAWLLRDYGGGNYKTVEEMPIDKISVIQGMSAEAIRKEMDRIPML